MKEEIEMTSERAAAIQSAEAKANGGIITKGSFAARAMKAAAKNKNKVKLTNK